jgi:hypothetical protein
MNGLIYRTLLVGAWLVAALSPARAGDDALGTAVGSTLPAALADARSSPIKDHAGLFRPETIIEAKRLIRDLRRTEGVGLVIETVPAAPEADRKRLKHAGRKEVERFFAGWAGDRARLEKANGVYVLICEDPKHVQVVTGLEAKEAFTPKNAEVLRKLLVKELDRRGAGPDKALLAGVGQVRDAVHTNLTPSTPFPWMTVLWVILGILGFWLFLGLVRAKLHASENQGRSPTGQVGTWSGLLGGMFGTVAGHWIYDTLFKNDQPRHSEGAKSNLP